MPSSDAEEEGGQPLERVYLVGVQQKGSKSKYGYSIEQSLEELGRLASTAGLEACPPPQNPALRA